MEKILTEYTEEKSEWMAAIEDAIDAWRGAIDGEVENKLIEIFENVRLAMKAGAHFVVPVEWGEEQAKALDEALQKGVEMDVDVYPRFDTRYVIDGSGVEYMVAFTNFDELEKGAPSDVVLMDVDELLEKVLMTEGIEGVVINPWSQSFTLTKTVMHTIFKLNAPKLWANNLDIQTMDITTFDGDAIVNAANKSLLGGGGVDGAIHRAAGLMLLEECRGLGGCETGEAKMTQGYQLPAKHVIHTVGPVYEGKPQDAKDLRACYWNSLELARKNDLHSLAFPAISTGVYGYPLEEATKIALTTVHDWLKIYQGYGMTVTMACFNDDTTALYEKVWAEIEAADKVPVEEDAARLEQAIRYAMKHHYGSVRKGTQLPYIMHPMETMNILSKMHADNNLMIAGVLHDVLEDTSATVEDLLAHFGADVTALVYAHTEDKSKLWIERKWAAILRLEYADKRSLMLTLADKVSNLRSLYSDYQKVGDDLWQRFNAPVWLQSWYYSFVNDGLEGLAKDEDTRDAYWEMTNLYKDTFVTYLLDEKKNRIYQISVHGENFVLKKGDFRWQAQEGWPEPENVSLITRKEAEGLENEWTNLFKKTVEKDKKSNVFILYQGEGRIVHAAMHNDRFILCEGKGSKIEDFDVERDNAIPLDEEATMHLLVQLRLKHGLRNKLETILKKEFGYLDGAERFNAYLESIGIGDEEPEA